MHKVNGGCAEGMGRQSNATRIKGVTHQPFGPDDLQPHIGPPMQTRDGRPVRTGPEAIPGPEDTYVACGKAWANVSNTPLREYKHWVHEGGIAAPLIVHWPAGVPRARRNSLVHEPGQLPDIMATCVDLAGAKYPSEFQGQKITPLAGRSLTPAFAGQAVERDGLFWEHGGNRAVRVGDWKLAANGPRGVWELYNLATDRTEMHDLANQQPERVKELAAQWNAWARRSNVLPWPWNPSDDAPARSASTNTHVELEPR